MKHLRPTLVFLLFSTLLFGGIYPLLAGGMVQALFPAQAQGSLILGKEGAVHGSALIGQHFTKPQYFWGRLSATAPTPYNAAASTGSNYGPTHPSLLEATQARIAALRAGDPTNSAPLPANLVTASASGLDPHISPEAAAYQVARVAQARGLGEAQVKALVARYTEGRQFGLLGEPRVHVLKLNLALDGKL